MTAIPLPMRRLSIHSVKIPDLLRCQEALTWGKTHLASLDCNHLEVELIMARVLGISRAALLARPEQQLFPEQLQHFQAWIIRRGDQEPFAYLTGEREFWSLPFEVTRDTLIPRPDTETLVEAVLDRYTKASRLTVADLGTGSGAIALSLAYERPQWCIAATDCHLATLQVAKRNSQHLKLAQQVHFAQGNWGEPFAKSSLDLIVTNPPYLTSQELQTSPELRFEPTRALDGGGDGLQAIKIILHHARDCLKPGGAIFVEHGSAQGEILSGEMIALGYRNLCSFYDLAGHWRVTLGIHQF